MPLPTRSARAALAGIAALSILAVGACGDDSVTEPGDDVTLTLTIAGPDPLTLHVGQNGALTTTLATSDGSVPDGLPIAQWLSRSPAVATVNAAGVVRGTSVGQTYVVAELTTSTRILRDSVRVDVSPAVTPQ